MLCSLVCGLKFVTLQGSSSSYKVKFSNNTSLPKPFLQLDDRGQRLRDQQASHSSVYLRSFRKRVTAKSGGSQGWDFGRFIKTLYFFNGPPSPLKVLILIEVLIKKKV